MKRETTLKIALFAALGGVGVLVALAALAFHLVPINIPGLTGGV